MRSAMYTPEQNTRIQLGLFAERPDDAPTVFRVAVTANLVATNAPQLKLLALDAIADGRTSLVVSLMACADVDARGFGVLVGLANAARRAGGSLTIAHCSADVRALFELHGIAKLFAFEPGEVTP